MAGVARPKQRRRPLITTPEPLEPHAARAPRQNMASLLEEMRQKAESLTVTDAELAAWYAAQLEWTEASVERIGAVQMRNLDRMVGAKADDSRWARYWAQEARYRYLADTLALLEQRGHVLVCATHGIDGVAPAAFEAYGPLQSVTEALSLRGLLTGEGATAWERHCVECAPLERVVRELQEGWAR